MPYTNPVIINAALTGMVPTKSDSPHLPVTVEEIVADCEAVQEAGATIVHLHPRDEHGTPSNDPALYRRLIAAVRERCPDLLISATCSGRLRPRLEDRALPLSFEGILKPDLASLTCGSLNFPRQASVTDPEMICALAQRMREAGIKPEIEVFEPGMIHTAKYLTKSGVLAEPLYVNILLGNLGTCPAGALELGYMLASLPPDAVWSAAGLGRHQLPVNTLALALGGHVRVGLEDALHYDWETRLLATNRQLVERVVRVAAELGRRPATPAQARAMLGLPQSPP